MTSELIFKEENLNDRIILELSGEVDIYTSQALKDKLYSVIDENKTDLILDCKQLNYIDSTGLGIFVSALKKSKQIEKKITIVNLKESIKKLFIITGLDKLFIIQGDAK